MATSVFLQLRKKQREMTKNRLFDPKASPILCSPISFCWVFYPPNRTELILFSRFVFQPILLASLVRSLVGPFVSVYLHLAYISFGLLCFCQAYASTAASNSLAAFTRLWPTRSSCWATSWGANSPEIEKTKTTNDASLCRLRLANSSCVVRGGNLLFFTNQAFFFFPISLNFFTN